MSKKSKKKKMKHKERTCMHVMFIGQTIITTDASCPKASMCLGNFVCLKGECQTCKKWVKKEKIAGGIYG